MLHELATPAWPPTVIDRVPARRSTPAVRVREIEARDLGNVAALLGRGFERPSAYYATALMRLNRHPTPVGCPKFGYLMEVDAKIVGAILLIFSTRDCEGSDQLWCNVTSWYVEPAFKSYAALFASRAFRRKDATYVNISARPIARPIIKAQGFSAYSQGQFVALPALHLSCATPAKVTSFDDPLQVSCERREHDVLAAHAELGCMSVWCSTADRAYPFVFLPRLFKRCLPGVQLIYCRDVEDIVRFARPLGRFLAARGLFLLSMDANGAIPEMIGVYLNGKSPRFFKGSKPPRLGDLAYTQAAMFPWPELPRHRTRSAHSPED
jgi:hypothetical protein